jgi:hypothetical protein
VDGYQLGKDIQQILEKLNSSKSCGCKQNDGLKITPQGRNNLIEFLNQFRELVNIVKLSDGSDSPIEKAWKTFKEKYQAYPGGKFCCCYTDHFNGEHCFTLDALTKADAWASCTAQVPSDCMGYNVSNGAC